MHGNRRSKHTLDPLVTLFRNDLDFNRVERHSKASSGHEFEYRQKLEGKLRQKSEKEAKSCSKW